MLPVHHPDGWATEATEATVPLSVLLGSRTVACIPGLTWSMADSWMPNRTCIFDRSGISRSTWSLCTVSPSAMSGVSFHWAVEG